MRRPLAAYVMAAAVATALVGCGRTSSSARSLGLSLALNVLIGVSFHVMMGTVHGERERKTLAFVLSLPATPRDVGLAKVLSAFLIFLIPSLVAVGPLMLMAPETAGWGLYACLLGAWLCVFAVVLATGVVTESIGATIGALIGLLFVGGNWALQVAPRSAAVARAVAAIARGSAPALLATFAVEATAIGAIVTTMVWLQGRKTSFV